MWIISDYWRCFNNHWRYGIQFCISAACVAGRMLLVAAQAWLRKSIPEHHLHGAKDRNTCSGWIQKFTNPFACPTSYTCWSEVCILTYVLCSFVPVHTCYSICWKTHPKQRLVVLHVNFFFVSEGCFLCIEESICCIKGSHKLFDGISISESHVRPKFIHSNLKHAHHWGILQSHEYIFEH